ncbi:MAG: lipoprotein-releasing ABC transporter permease subunit [Gammaproteobacteria bacterium]|nr:lipoprotein-releasing ABC transporter permease subunit [Gammaproteobacteria bacterium]
MYQPLSLFIALRYLRTKRRNRFATFISYASVFGIGLGAAVLIIVLSVMNGFEREVSRHILDMTAHASVFKLGGSLEQWRQVADKLRATPQVTGVEPFIRGSGMLNYRGQVRGVVVYGVPAASEANVSNLHQYLPGRSLAKLSSTAGPPRTFIGKTLASNLGVHEGEIVTLILPRWSDHGSMLLPLYQPLMVTGVFSAGMHEFDSTFAILDLEQAAKIYGFKDAVTGLRVRFNDSQQAPQLAQHLQQVLGASYATLDWTQYHQNFFVALKSQKRILFMILSLIIAVAAFNIIASMIMVVKEKTGDIAILRTLGYGRRNVLAVFVTQGVIIAASGIALGIGGGLLGARYADPLMHWLEQLFGVQFIKPDVYYISYLPTQVAFSDVAMVSAVTFFIGVLATLYPAWRAAQIAPGEALRAE